MTSNQIFNSKGDRAISLVLILGLFLSLLYLHIVNRNGIDDDAYIHFRIVENFITHGVFNFNVEEAVYASTSVIWLLVLRVSAFLGPDLILNASILNACVTSMFVVVFALLLRRKHQMSFCVSGLIAAVSTLPVLYSTSIGLMETPLAMLAIFVAIALLSGHAAGALMLAGVSMFIRPELVVFFGLLSISELKSGLAQKRLNGVATNFVGAALVVAGLLSFCIYNWGTIVPQPTIAKPIVYGMLPHQTASMFNYLAFNVELSDPRLTNIVYRGCAALVLVGMFLTMWSVVSREGSERGKLDNCLVLLCGGAIVVLAYCYSKTLLHSWYGPVFIIPIITGILLRHNAFVGKFQLGVSVLIGLLQASFSFFPTTDSINWGHSRAKCVQDYLQIGNELRSQAPNAKVLSPEIGALGWGFKGYIYDAVGLATPAAVQFHPLRVPDERPSRWHGAIPPRMVEALLPDVIVTPAGLADALLRSEFINRYSQSADPSLNRECVLTFYRKGYITSLSR